MFSEIIYEKINLSYQETKDSSLDTKIITCIKEYAEDADYDFDGLIDLHACLNYIDYFEIDIDKDILRKIFNILSNYDNEMYIMLQGEFIASQYMDSLLIMKLLV